MHQDKVGNHIAIGDEVVYSVSARSTRLGIGTVEAITATRIHVRESGCLSSHQPDRVIKVIRENYA